LQGTNGHADQLGDLLSALSSLNEIPDLLESLRSKYPRRLAFVIVMAAPFGSRPVVTA
jgi:hypothetical protein